MGIQHGDTLTINFGWCSPWWLNWRWWLRATPNEDMICVNQDWAIKYLGPLSSNGDIELAAARVARLMSERIKNFGGAQKQLQVDIYIWYIYIYIYDIYIYIYDIYIYMIYIYIYRTIVIGVLACYSPTIRGGHAMVTAIKITGAHPDHRPAEAFPVGCFGWQAMSILAMLGWHPEDFNGAYRVGVGGLELWNFMTFHMNWECHHPNWRSPSFFRGVGQPPTSWCCSTQNESNQSVLRRSEVYLSLGQFSQPIAADIAPKTCLKNQHEISKKLTLALED